MMTHVTLVYNPLAKATRGVLPEVLSALQAARVSFETLALQEEDDSLLTLATTHLIIVLGGDGTLLRVAQRVAHHQQASGVQGFTPLVGINTGHLGFLTRIEAQRLSDYLPRLLAGDFTVEHRRLLMAYGGQANTAGASPLLAVNDVVLKNANPSQMASFNLTINHQMIARTQADGVIIATPTGSTAYTLAAGGPIVAPDVEALVVTPICPHSFTAKPIVISSQLSVCIEAVPKRPDSQMVISVDGREAGVLRASERLTIQQAKQTLPLVTFDAQPVEGFFNLLHQKLQWATDPRSLQATSTGYCPIGFEDEAN